MVKIENLYTKFCLKMKNKQDLENKEITEMASDFISLEYSKQVDEYNNKYDQGTPGSKIDLGSIDYNIL